jgi:hypothetical protein
MEFSAHRQTPSTGIPLQFRYNTAVGYILFPFSWVVASPLQQYALQMAMTQVWSKESVSYVRLSFRKKRRHTIWTDFDYSIFPDKLVGHWPMSFRAASVHSYQHTGIKIHSRLINRVKHPA